MLCSIHGCKTEVLVDLVSCQCLAEVHGIYEDNFFGHSEGCLVEHSPMSSAAIFGVIQRLRSIVEAQPIAMP